MSSRSLARSANAWSGLNALWASRGILLGLEVLCRYGSVGDGQGGLWASGAGVRLSAAI
jgi:hypothetical protein